MTKAVEFENLLYEFAVELSEEELKEIERVFERMTIVEFLRSLR